MYDRPALRFDKRNVLLDPEREIVDALSERDILAIQGLRSENLTKERHRILGIRSEDLFYFIRCVQRGFIPVSVHELRGKTGESHLYLTANPESGWLRENDPDGFNPGSSFRKTVQTNLRTYAKIAKLQALYRNVIRRIPDQQTFQDDIRRYTYENYGGKYFESVDQMSLEMAGEDFYNDLLEVLSAQGDVMHPDMLETRAILYRALPQLATSLKSPFEKLLRSLSRRSGICVAFSEDIAREYAEDRKAQDADDLVYHIPSCRLPIEHIVGFEPLGEYEDEVLTELGIE